MNDELEQAKAILKELVAMLAEQGIKITVSLEVSVSVEVEGDD